MTEKQTKFLALWTSEFGALTENNGLRRFMDFVDHESRSIDILGRAIERLAYDLEGGVLKRRPAFTQLKKAYFELAGRPQYAADRRPQDSCARCQDSGFSYLVFAGENAGTAKPLLRKARYFPYIAKTTIPCMCIMGIRKNEGAGYPMDRLKQLHDQCVIDTKHIDAFIDECRAMGGEQVLGSCSSRTPTAASKSSTAVPVGSVAIDTPVTAAAPTDDEAIVCPF